METTGKIQKQITRAENRVPTFVLPTVKFLIFAGDAVLAAACFLLAFKFREGDAVFSPTAWAWSRDFVPYAGILFFAAPCRLAMLLYQRVYRLHGAFSYTNEAIKIFKATAVSSLLIVSWAFLFRGGFAFRNFSYSRGVFLFDFVFALVVYSTFFISVCVSRRRFSGGAT